MSESKTASTPQVKGKDTQSPATYRPDPVFVRLGDILKAEASTSSRIVVNADNISIGQLVEHPTRKQYLVALSDSERGKVLLQPHNCTINLDFVALTDITSKKDVSGGGKALSVDELKKQGDSYGIKYIGTPFAAPLSAPAEAPISPTKSKSN